jgi:hypothetical protein
MADTARRAPPIRDVDVTEISRTGIVADGVEFPDPPQSSAGANPGPRAPVAR